MRAKLIRIGNSRGVRSPKPVIEEAALGDEVELRVVDGALVIRSSRAPRTGWADAARRMRENDADRLLDESTGTEFDETHWRWR